MDDYQLENSDVQAVIRLHSDTVGLWFETTRCELASCHFAMSGKEA